MSNHVVHDEELRAFCNLAGVQVSIDQSRQCFVVSKRLLSGTRVYLSVDYSATADVWRSCVATLVEEAEARNEGLRQ